MLKKILIGVCLSLALLDVGAGVTAQAQSGDRRQIAQRARRLYRSGRLSRSHYQRTIAKLNQRKGRRWNRQVDNTLSEWSRAHTRRRRR